MQLPIAQTEKTNLSLRCSGVKPSFLGCLVFPPALAWALSRSRSLWLPRSLQLSTNNAIQWKKKKLQTSITIHYKETQKKNKTMLHIKGYETLFYGILKNRRWRGKWGEYEKPWTTRKAKTWWIAREESYEWNAKEKPRNRRWGE